MIGREYKPEKRYYKDPLTGNEVCQLTGGDSHNYHFYFTENSFSLGDKEIYFFSDRGRPPVFNLFKMDLTTGIITQLTDEKKGLRGRAAKTPDSKIVVYKTENTIKKLDTQTGQADPIYVETDNWELGAMSISCDNQYVGFLRNESVQIEGGPNYSGFKERLYAIKISLISLINLKDLKVSNILENTHWIGHFQFAPDDNKLAMFCHEGPWHIVHQRIWLLDIQSSQFKPCFRQGENDCVGHEFWTRDGKIFFDNRGAGHDGTITSNKTQTILPLPKTGQRPYIGLADKNGKMIRKIDMPHYCNHYHANNDNTLLVGDEVEDLVLIDLKDNNQPVLKKLCYHGTSWQHNNTHTHPTFGWKGEKILFASDKEGGKVNLYLIDADTES